MYPPNNHLTKFSQQVSIPFQHHTNTGTPKKTFVIMRLCEKRKTHFLHSISMNLCLVAVGVFIASVAEICFGGLPSGTSITIITLKSALKFHRLASHASHEELRVSLLETYQQYNLIPNREIVIKMYAVLKKTSLFDYSAEVICGNDPILYHIFAAHSMTARLPSNHNRILVLKA